MLCTKVKILNKNFCRDRINAWESKNMSDSLTLWYRASRGYTFGLSAIPYLLGSFLASINYAFNLKFCVLGLIGIVLVHASFNLLDGQKLQRT